MFSSKRFIMSHLTFTSLIYFEFSVCVCVYDVRECSNFTLLHVTVQFSQHHLLERLSFSLLYICSSWAIDQATISAWVHLQAFEPIPSTYFLCVWASTYSLDYCNLQYSLMSRNMVPPALLCFLRILWLFTVFSIF